VSRVIAGPDETARSRPNPFRLAMLRRRGPRGWVSVEDQSPLCSFMGWTDSCGPRLPTAGASALNPSLAPGRNGARRCAPQQSEAQRRCVLPPLVPAQPTPSYWSTGSAPTREGWSLSVSRCCQTHSSFGVLKKTLDRFLLPRAVWPDLLPPQPGAPHHTHGHLSPEDEAIVAPQPQPRLRRTPALVTILRRGFAARP